LGLFCIANALKPESRIPPAYFTIPLVVDVAWALLSSFSLSGAARKLRMAKVAVVLCVILFIFTAPRYSGVVIGILIGIFLMLDASLRGVGAWVIHFDGWRRSLVFAVVEFCFGLWSLVPWPTHWEGAVGVDVGTLLVLSATGVCGLARRIRTLPRDMPILTAMSRGWGNATRLYGRGASAAMSAAGEGGTVIVHVWTPTSGLVPINRAISRYIAAPDGKGVISSGHAALELGEDVYISHYPAAEIDRTVSEFTSILRATSDNDVDGLFQSSYSQESADWCPSTMQVRLPGLNVQAVREFWAAYRTDATYNLTNRNCSSVVVKALDIGLDGLFEKEMSVVFFVRFILTSEFRIAGFIRHRAAATAWTPGLVLDYARALSHILAMEKETLLREDWEGDAG
ncbi:MAG: hypothetical protein LBR94_00295, partial [Desulfovibrio sp.]|jgi:hypothetical protein|nr:hypothetical protein [Desulfovibrio sp.]